MKTDEKVWLGLFGLAVGFFVGLVILNVLHEHNLLKKRVACLEIGQVYHRVDDVEECVTYEPGA